MGPGGRRFEPCHPDIHKNAPRGVFVEAMLFFDAHVVHPRDVGASDAEPDRHSDCADDNATSAQPCEPGQEPKERVVKRGRITGERRAINQARRVRNFATEQTEPGVFSDG